MRRAYLAILTVAVSFGVVDPAAAVIPKPPKSLCVQFTDGIAQFQMILATRPASGAIRTQNMTYRAYTVSGQAIATAGAILISPISGTGYMNGTLFRFSITGATPFFTVAPMSATGVWDVSGSTGNIFVNNGGTHYDGFLSEIPCTAVAVP